MAKKVLCVEDNPINLEIISAILQNMGYDVYHAEEGQEAINHAIKVRPDLILMDLHLPGIDGIEATKQIKSHPDLTSTPIIAVTADIYSRQAFIEASGDAYLTKPIRSGTLLRTIQQVLATNQSAS